MALNILNKNREQKGGNESSLPGVPLTKQEAEIMLTFIKQATFKGEFAKEVVSLMEKFEKHISSLD
jgi:hypothetical protein